jgi:hypothetical protein
MSWVGCCLQVEKLTSHWTCRDQKPYFHWLGNMHGDEPSGRQLTLSLALHMCQNREDPLVRETLERIHLVVAPTLNPDGFALKTRANRCDALSLSMAPHLLQNRALSMCFTLAR